MTLKDSYFDEYIRQGEPQQKEKGLAWQTAIGLQAVDGLTPSDYLIETARAHIEGDITIDEAKARVDSYYMSKPAASADLKRTEEADKVSTRITEILSENTFSLSPVEYISIHKRLFDGLYTFAGQIRNYNISKKEWVLNGSTVIYGDAANLMETLAYDISLEKQFSYNNLSVNDIVKHITKFVSDLWQIHPFGEGNTRTTAVFTIKYLRTLGFDVNNDTFASHSWYFRNALVRANYTNVRHGIFATPNFLELFFRNLLMSDTNELKNRNLLVNVGEKEAECRRNVGEMSEKQTQILKLIQNNNKISANKLATELKVTSRTIERELKFLKDSGRIVRIGGARGGHWELR